MPQTLQDNGTPGSAGRAGGLCVHQARPGFGTQARPFLPDSVHPGVDFLPSALHCNRGVCLPEPERPWAAAQPLPLVISTRG